KKAEKALAGCVLFLDYQGEINVIKGLVAKSERKALKALHDEKAKKSTKGGQDTQNASGDKTANTSTSAPVVEYSNALSDDLKAHRLVMAKHALMLNSNLAIDALHYSLCIRAFVPFGSTPLDVSINRTDLEPKQGDFAENQALARIEAHKDNLDLTWLEVNDSKERFEAFVKLDADEKQKQVAYASALMLRASMAQDDGRFDFEFLYQELSFDAAD
ncbi:hypothetical protein AKJ18_22425, partial [Vibrio xuii]